MPAKGKHRRTRTSPFSRGLLAAGTGGAAIALPLIGATGAHAAEKAAPATEPHAVSAAAQTSQHASAKKTATKAPKIYSVVAGDYLSKIASEQHVRGGWHKLYADNRKAVGPDPSLIHPGLKLTIGAKSSGPHKPAGHHSKPGGTDAQPGNAPAKPSDDPAPVKTGTPAADPVDDNSGSGFTLPVDGIAIGTPYHASGSNWSSGYHTGVDFLAPSGTVVKAVGAGTVVSAGWGGSYGNQVVIQHDDGHYSQYGHLSSISVSEGDTVSEGQQIGLSGATGNVTGPHLHFEIRTGPDYGSDIDPLAFLREHGVSV
ncbi:LysM peptidoglycan-binding domain-containing M23 family metallopeptidase [Streptomyces sp. NPDC006923]|uniref:M23 family metallopeptidase n=1 Tax=Streptomyces sp. NPDC006923 TaxID=3155355 RepID=UPI00340266F2